jgi:hypothetical protein
MINHNTNAAVNPRAAATIRCLSIFTELFLKIECPLIDISNDKPSILHIIIVNRGRAYCDISCCNPWAYYPIMNKCGMMENLIQDVERTKIYFKCNKEKAFHLH